ncbi:MAG: DUF342 domain-containing protein [Oscillospiraceae bacterium]|jgi:predicted nuclease with TOPRIM domain|nr:DUF342 domain-containing protein [Oscillospiraceae bacterium]
MPRKKAGTVPEQIADLAQRIKEKQAELTKLKKRYKELCERQDQADEAELLDAMKSSGKSKEEILQMLHQG